MKVTVLNLQTISDIAIQYYGDISAAIYIAKVNNMSLTEDLSPDIMLEMPEIVFNKPMQTYCRTKNIKPATAIDNESELNIKIFSQQFNQVFK